MNELSPHKSVDELSDEIIDLVEKIPATAIEIRKLQIGFWDKLVLLNAGTLALSFSAATAFRGHTVGDGGVGYLFAAWKLLMSSMICGVLAQWLAAVGSQHLQTGILSRLIAARMLKINFQLPDFGAGEHKKLEAKSEIATRFDSRIWSTAVGLGVAAVVCTILAFGYLYSFAAANLRTFLHA